MLKDPDAKLPFEVDWTAWLTKEADTIASVAWAVPNGLTLADPPPTHADGKATVWLSGGAGGQQYAVTCRITTAGGRIDERTFRVRVQDR